MASASGAIGGGSINAPGGGGSVAGSGSNGSGHGGPVNPMGRQTDTSRGHTDGAATNSQIANSFVVHRKGCFYLSNSKGEKLTGCLPSREAAYAMQKEANNNIRKD